MTQDMKEPKSESENTERRWQNSSGNERKKGIPLRYEN